MLQIKKEAEEQRIKEIQERREFEEKEREREMQRQEELLLKQQKQKQELQQEKKCDSKDQEPQMPNQRYDLPPEVRLAHPVKFFYKELLYQYVMNSFINKGLNMILI